MKTELKILLFYLTAMVLSACNGNNRENELESFNSSFKDGKTLSGKISNYPGTGIDKLKLYGIDTVVAEGNVSFKGEFTVTFSTPSKLINIQDYLGGDFNGEISDKGAFVYDDDFLGAMAAYKDNKGVGYIFRGNIETFDDSDTPPYSLSLFMYSDRKTIIKGNNGNDYYDLTLYKGWNEVVWKVIENSSSKQSVRISNVVTDDMSWRFSSDIDN